MNNTPSSSQYPLKKCSTPPEILDLIKEVVRNNEKLGRFSTFSPAVYDTAWLSIVHRKTEGQIHWKYPACFDVLLQSQREDGTWDAAASPVDGILNTLAALLALLTRRDLSLGDFTEESALSWRIKKAQTGLQLLLQRWNVDDTVHVGFEILVPSLLRQVGKFGIRFEFSNQRRLEQLYASKIKRFTPALVYSEQQTTLLHSLEALIDLIDFDRVSHHCNEQIGIFGSPASTAAYLLNCSHWDERAEAYLDTVVETYRGCGGVPSAFPTCIFEISWALSTMLCHGISAGDLEDEASESITSFLIRVLEDQKGVVGFAPGILRDADDTARVLLTLQRLGKDVDLGPMVDTFQSKDHFRTYEMEQSPSFSANCNILLTLLEAKDVDFYLAQIEKTVVFLLSAWECGSISDKWNLSPRYSWMLLASALVRVLERYSAGQLQQLPLDLVEKRTPLCICQILSRTLTEQHDDGSWDGSIEVSAYSVLTLARCLSLPWATDLKILLLDLLGRGRKFIQSKYPSTSEPEYLWVEKVTYGSSLLSQTYCVSALHVTCDERDWSPEVQACFPEETVGSRKLRQLFSKLPIFRHTPLPSIDLALFEAAVFSERLEEARHAVFPRDAMPMTQDKYIKYIPIIWTACNQLKGCTLSSQTLWSMLQLSLLNYQIDEYMESVVVSLAEQSLPSLLAVIAQECGLSQKSESENTLEAMRLQRRDLPKAHPHTESSLPLQSRQHQQAPASLYSIAEVLTKYIRHVLQHPSVLRAPPTARHDLALELHNFLLAHMKHNLANTRLRRQPRQRQPTNGHHHSHILQNPSGSSYFNWARSDAADDTSCPFSFQFFACLINPPGHWCFRGPQATYLSQSFARHLATMCRQYNDYGSAARDADEGNLNSLDFPDFGVHSSDTAMEDRAGLANGADAKVNRDAGTTYTSRYRMDEAKAQLMEIAEFERECMQLAMCRLEQNVHGPDAMKALEVFVNVTDVFGQVYVLKDIASRVQMMDGAKAEAIDAHSIDAKGTIITDSPEKNGTEGGKRFEVDGMS